MTEDTKQTDKTEQGKLEDSKKDSPGTPPALVIPAAGTLAGADEEKASMVEQAKTRVAAVKESLESKPSEAAGPGAPKPPVKKKEEGPNPAEPSTLPKVIRWQADFGDAHGGDV